MSLLSLRVITALSQSIQYIVTWAEIVQANFPRTHGEMVAFLGAVEVKLMTEEKLGDFAAKLLDGRWSGCRSVRRQRCSDS